MTVTWIIVDVEGIRDVLQTQTMDYINEKEQQEYLLPAPTPNSSEPKQRRKCLALRMFARSVAFIMTFVLFYHIMTMLPNLPNSPCPHAASRMDAAAILKSADYVHEYGTNQTAGFTIEGGIASGDITFTTSKVKKDYKIEVDLEYSSNDLKDKIEWIVRDNTLVLSVPTGDDDGKKHINVTAKVSLPSDILIGKEALRGFIITAPDFDVDYSSLGSKLEIDEWSINVAKGSIKTGTVATNHTALRTGSGKVYGDLSLARDTAEIDVAVGNVDLNVGASQSERGSLAIKAGSGNITGSYLVENEATITAAKGNVYLDVTFADTSSKQNASLATNVASGQTRVFVKSLGKGDNVAFSAQHSSVSGSFLLTYPDSFAGRITARDVMGEINLRGDGLEVEKQWFGVAGSKGENGRGEIEVRTFKGDIDFLVGKE